VAAHANRNHEAEPEVVAWAPVVVGEEEAAAAEEVVAAAAAQSES
jgi:hypothetical protein